MPCVQAHWGSVDRNWTFHVKQVFLTRHGRVATSDLVYHYSIHSPTETLRSYLPAIAQFTKTSPRNSLEATLSLIMQRNFCAYIFSHFSVYCTLAE